MHQLRFRQIHLDFHTSPNIPGIGEKFDKKKFQDTLLEAGVNSITLFAKCHHGWSYHPTQVGKQHPHLDFDLLRAQFEACKEVDINAPIYISAGVDNVAFEEHPEWHELGPDGQLQGWANTPLRPGFHRLDFASPYLDYLCEQTVEVVRMFPDCDGIFSDIISQGPCATKWTLALMKEHNLDPLSEQDQQKAIRMRLLRYYEKFTAACRVDNPDMPVFHNAGHITRGDREILEYFSHMELESLPTGGWGYDHFPASARYVNLLPYDYLGMTGKFHSTWGEFGGYKHPNALRYECASMIAHGAKCSVGDQLHPSGEIDASTYKIIGKAYNEVAAKEAWCDNVKPVAEIAVISSEAAGSEGKRNNAPDTGAGRILLEGHFLFDLLDTEMPLDHYRLVILPDDIRVGDTMKTKLDAFLAKGGKLLLTGSSGLDADGKLMFDAGCEVQGQSPMQPDFILPIEKLRADFCDNPLVMYAPNHRVKLTDGESLGDVYDPYFNRTWQHFCSHQHTPPMTEPSGFVMGSTKGNVTYVGHSVFSNYAGFGAVAYREVLQKLITHVLDDAPAVSTNMPTTARVTLNRQDAENRYVLHLLYANTISRGGPAKLSGGTVTENQKSFEVIEELMPLRDVRICLRLPNGQSVSKITLEPQGVEHPFTVENDEISLRLDEFTCHQMVVLHD